ncbi:MAG: hypothetical protein HQK52_23855, partial [Oligoflexia bacterium]|nr:hypothetical protein [Oligoflexia bacterium]
HFNGYCSKTSKKLKLSISNYFQSYEHEKDLDSILNILYAHMKKNAPHPQFSSDFKKRIKQKRMFLMKQTGMFIATGALAGVYQAIESGNIGMIGEYCILGAAGAIIIVIVTTAGVIIKPLLRHLCVDKSNRLRHPVFI